MMNTKNLILEHIKIFSKIAIMAFFAYLVYLQHYVFFNAILSLYIFAVGFSLFIIVWTTRENADNYSLIYLGIGYVFISTFNVFSFMTSNGIKLIYDTPIFFITVGLMDASTFLIFACISGSKKKYNYFVIFISYLIASVGISYVINRFFTMVVPPAAILMLFLHTLCIWILIKRRKSFDTNVTLLLIKSTCFKIIYIIFFIYTTRNNLPNNFWGLFAKGLAYFFIYKAIVKTALKDPFTIIYSKMKTSELRYRSIYNNAYLGIAEISTSGSIIEVNHSLENLLGYSNAELAGKSFAEITHKDDIKTSLNYLKEILRGEYESVNFIKRYLTKQNGTLTADVYLKAIKDENNRVTSLVSIMNDITERKRIDDQLRKLYTAIDQAANIIVITDLNGIVEFVNPQFTLQTGYTPEEILGRNLRILKTNYHDREYYYNLWDTITKGLQWKGDFLNRKKDGSLYWESCTITPVTDLTGRITSFIAIKEDISEIKKIQDDLKDAKEQWETTFDTIPDLIAIVDISGKIIRCNRAMQNFLIDKQDMYIEDRRYIYFTTNEGVEEIYINNMIEEDSNSHEIFINRLAKYFLLSISPLYTENGVCRGYVYVARDITTMKQIEAQLKESNATKDKFFSIIAHDLKNPFQGIIGLTETVMNYKEMQQKEMYEIISLINDAAKSTYNLLSNLLDWSRAQHDSLKYTPVPVHLNYVLRETIGIFKNYATNKEISLELTDPQEAFIFADENMVRTIFRNIVNNAIKFTYPGGKVIITLEGRDNLFAIAISDTGMGIALDDPQKLFRVDTHFTMPGTNDERGTGLGLVLCYEFVKKNHGDITVKSAPGKGSTFTVTFPVYQEAFNK